MQRWLCNTPASLLWVLGVSRGLLAQRLSHHGKVNALLGRQKEESPHQCVAPNLITTSTSSRKIHRLSYEYVLWGPCEQFDRGSQGKKQRVSFYRIHVFNLKQESASFSQNRLYFFFQPQAAFRLSQNITNSEFTKPLLDSPINFYLDE